MGAVRRIALAAAAFAVTICGPVNADDYPSRPVKIIVPFGAGGPTDVYTRAIGEELRKALHQPFVMDNRPGAGTTIGTDFVAKSPPTATRF
jgi:tripartite-type tricarboxylate transporter receptor subunit TctC